MNEFYREYLLEKVTSIGKIKDPFSRFDLLIVGFKEAKSSILEYSRSSKSLKTLSMHFYGQEILDKSGESELHCISTKVRTDPEDRCIMMSISSDMFSFIPFREAENSREIPDKPPFLNSYVIKSTQLHEKIINVKDFTFLPGFYEPTIAVLFEPKRTWTGRLAAIKDTVCLAIISVDLNRQNYATIFFADNLPFDCFTLSAVPKPIGGVLVVSNNAILHFDQGSIGSGISLNAYAKSMTNFPFFDGSRLALHLDSSKHTYVAPNVALFVLGDGKLVQLTLNKEGRSISGFDIQVIGRELQLPSCMVKLDKTYTFIGSCNNESILIDFRPTTQAIDGINSRKRMKMSAADDELDVLMGVAEDKSEEKPENTEEIEEIDGTYKIIDRLNCMSLVKDFTVGQSELNIDAKLTASPLPNGATMDVVICSGEGLQSSLHILRRTLRPDISNTFDLAGKAIDIWNLRCNSKNKVKSPHRYILISRKADRKYPNGSSVVLDAANNLARLDESNFFLDGCTICAAEVLKSTHVLQAYQGGFRLINSFGKMTTEMSLAKDFNVESCRVSDELVAFSGMNHIILYKISSPKKIECLEEKLEIPEKILCMDIYHDISGFITGNTGSYFLLVVSKSGVLMIYDIALKKFVYLLSGLGNHGLVLKDFREGKWNLVKSENLRDELADIKLINLGESPNEKLHLLCVTESQDVLIYEVYRFKKFLRFKKKEIGIPLSYSEKRKKQDSSNEPSSEFDIEELEEESIPYKKRKIIPFNSISGFESHLNSKKCLPGVFIALEKPLWVYQTSRAELRMHGMTFDGPITCFSEFSNEVCGDGFIYFNHLNQMRVCNIDKYFDLGYQWCSKTLKLNSSAEEIRTASFIEYHKKSGKYCMVSHIESSCNLTQLEILPATETRDESGEINPVYEQPEEVHSGEYLPSLKRGVLELLSPKTWNFVDKYEFRENESVISMSHCLLKVKVSGMIQNQPYIIVSTGFVKGEDQQVRGRLYIFDIIEVVPEIGRPDTNHKLKLICKEEMKGAVGAICSLDGYVCVSIGPKIMLYSFENGESVVGIAFLDTNLFITSMKSVKSYLIIGDITKGTWFVAYQEEPSKMIVLGKNFYQTGITDSEFLLDESKLALVTADTCQNIQVLTYSPNHVATSGGLKLLKKADYYLQSSVVSLKRTIKRNENSQQGTIYGKYFRFYGSI